MIARKLLTTLFARFAWIPFLVHVTPAIAQLTPISAYVGVNRPVIVRVACPDDVLPAAPREILLTHATGEQIAIARVNDADDAVDLAQLFPLIWASGDLPMLYVQLVVDGAQVGAPLVIHPLDTPARIEDGLTSRVRSGDIPLSELAKLPQAKRDELATEIVVNAPEPSTRSGLRIWIDQRILLGTDAGELELALRPDHAPNTCYHFLQLVKEGIYENVPFHRVVAADALGRPFIIQTGDPTGTGGGGCGFSIDFEPSTLPHNFGVVSMARRADDPNSASSQFFICLGRESCASLDGAYTSFAEVVRGAEAVATIAATPTGANNRPLDPPMVRHARAVPAPTLSSRAEAPPVTPSTPPERPR